MAEKVTKLTSYKQQTKLTTDGIAINAKSDIRQFQLNHS